MLDSSISGRELRGSDSSCTLMVRILQGALNIAIQNIGGTDKFIVAPHEKLDGVLDDIDKAFSSIYSGRQLKTVEDIVELAPASMGGGPGPVLAPAPYGGQTGFKKIYWEGNNPDNDQTHHFATYFSGGINGMSLTTTIHSLRDTDENDIALGKIAFSLGADLRKKTYTTVDRTSSRFPIRVTTDERSIDRSRRILGIAERVQEKICE